MRSFGRRLTAVLFLCVLGEASDRRCTPRRLRHRLRRRRPPRTAAGHAADTSRAGRARDDSLPRQSPMTSESSSIGTGASCGGIRRAAMRTTRSGRRDISRWRHSRASARIAIDTARFSCFSGCAISIPTAAMSAKVTSPRSISSDDAALADRNARQARRRAAPDRGRDDHSCGPSRSAA